MEPESSLLCLNGTAMYPSAAPCQSSPGPLSYFLKINFNIIIPCTPTSSKQARFLRFPLPQPCIHLSSPPTCCMSLSSHSSRFVHQMISMQCISRRSSLCIFLHSPLTLTLSGPSIFLSTLFSKTLSLRLSH
jgi:hypothetical protein